MGYKKYRIYSDGSTRANGTRNAVGAWAYVIVDDNGEVVCSDCGSEVGTTNQRMELTAAIQGLNKLVRLFSVGDVCTLYTDSAYLHNCYQEQWYRTWEKKNWMNSKKQPVANRDLWEKIIPFFDAWDFEFRKVKGHTEGSTEHEKWNNYVDALAQAASQKRKEEEQNNGNSSN